MAIILAIQAIPWKAGYTNICIQQKAIHQKPMIGKSFIFKHFDTKQAAMKREIEIKAWKSKIKIEKLILSSTE